MLSQSDKLLLTSGAAELGVDLSEDAVELFGVYAARLHETNQQLNLTRIPPEKTVSLHFLDSLTLAKAVDIPPGTALLDLGTGAGFPGLPLAIAYPRIGVILVDSTRKRLLFLEQLIGELGIQNVRLVHGRAEELEHSGLNRMFDIVTARAVAEMGKLAGWMIPFVKQGGCAVAYKSAEAAAEIDAARPAIHRLRGELQKTVEVKLPGEEITRLLGVVSVNRLGQRTELVNGARKVRTMRNGRPQKEKP